MDTRDENQLSMDSLDPFEKILAKDLRRVQQTHPDYSCVFLGSEDGGYLQYPLGSLPAEYDPRHRSWYKETKTAQNDTIITRDYVSSSGETVASVTSKIHDEQGEIIGIIGLDIDLSTLTKLKLRRSQPLQRAEPCRPLEPMRSPLFPVRHLLSQPSSHFFHKFPGTDHPGVRKVPTG